MNGKKGSSIEINIIPASIAEKISKIIFPCKGWFSRVSGFCKEDTSRVVFSLKVGLAVLLVSLLILFPAPYQVFGANAIWSILTVGATFNRGFNRAVGSLIAGVLATAIAEIASRSGPVAEPVIIGTSIFFIGTITTFMKLWPSLVPYEYGFRVALFTYCLIIVSGYQMGNPIKTSMDRLYSIAIGAIVAVLVNVLVCPIWAGEQLHNELVSSFNTVADSLEECVRKYLEDDGLSYLKFTKTVSDEPAIKNCRDTLNSATKIETLANSAKWEPPHGRFCHVFYPWSEYVKVSAVLRYCAYEVMALHGVLHSEIQAPYNLRITLQKEIQEAAAQAVELVRALGEDISSMQQSLKGCLLAKVHASTERLQRAIDRHSCFLIPRNETCDSNSPEQQQKLSQISSTNLDEISTHLADLEDSMLEENFDIPSLPLEMPAAVTNEQAYHELMKKQQRRLYSWLSREVDAYEDKGTISVNYKPKMKGLQSTITFASLIIELEARLDHLVEAVDQLSKMAKFKPEGL
ncbi:PREDICTED: aluminum-activated malate transporter 9-like isoform X2 [Ipomoea nil]|uniref:aluminum-activated malate transporter 9-like isoform X2 n=1 Tax=Ipomoea nil TaxID=35883 RepID=UPI000901A945|nr:PREDICTED: aluminum-activated malate transporter 9-like isoform X2 [Ipomoea nil]